MKHRAVGPERLRKAVTGLLTGKTRPAEAAHAGGWSSVRVFHEELVATYGVTAEAWARIPGIRHYRFSYGGAFHAPRTLAYLGRDPDSLCERVAGHRYTRHFPVGPGGKAHPVTLEIGEDGCEVTPPPLPSPEDYLELHHSIRRLLGLEQPLEAFYGVAGGHPVLGAMVEALPGVRMPQVPTLWEALSWAVVGQQINLSFAYRLRNRLVRLGSGLAEQQEGESPPPPPPVPFPTPEQVLAIPPETLRAHQFSRQKTEYLGQVARACLEGPLRGLSLEHATPGEAEQALLSVKGIGRWSAAYGLMRALGHWDALPVGDAGLRTALQRGFGLPTAPSTAAQEALMEPFRPFRALATYYLWKSLDATSNE